MFSMMFGKSKFMNLVLFYCWLVFSQTVSSKLALRFSYILSITPEAWYCINCSSNLIGWTYWYTWHNIPDHAWDLCTPCNTAINYTVPMLKVHCTDPHHPCSNIIRIMIAPTTVIWPGDYLEIDVFPELGTDSSIASMSLDVPHLKGPQLATSCSPIHRS